MGAGPRGFINYQAFDTIAGRGHAVDPRFQHGGKSPGVPHLSRTTPSGGGLDLTSDFSYDTQGRLVQSLGPIHWIDLSGTAAQFAPPVGPSIKTRWTRFGAQGYQTTAETSVVTLVNPVAISQYDDGGRSIGQIAVPRASTSGPLSSTDSLPQENYVRWSTSIYTLNLLTATRLYIDIPDSAPAAAARITTKRRTATTRWTAKT